MKSIRNILCVVIASMMLVAGSSIDENVSNVAPENTGVHVESMMMSCHACFVLAFYFGIILEILRLFLFWNTIVYRICLIVGLLPYSDFVGFLIFVWPKIVVTSITVVMVVQMT